MPKQNFNLDNIFYPRDILQEAKSVFHDFEIHLTSSGIEITNEDPQNIFDEFSNYCIALSNEQIA